MIVGRGQDDINTTTLLEAAFDAGSISQNCLNQMDLGYVSDSKVSGQEGSKSSVSAQYGTRARLEQRKLHEKHLSAVSLDV